LDKKHLFEELRGKDQKSLPTIAKVMNRTYQSVKNYNNQHFQPKKRSRHGIDFTRMKCKDKFWSIKMIVIFTELNASFKGCKSFS
jgi:hypothetical protein